MLGKNVNKFTQVAAAGTVDQLIDELQDKYNRPLPAADLSMSNAYGELMEGVYELEDLGSGVFHGTECDHLAFRKDEVDLQIWVAQGDRPYPCAFVVTSKLVPTGLEYPIQLTDWKTGDEVAKDDFMFTNATNAEKIEIDELKKQDRRSAGALYRRRRTMSALKRLGILVAVCAVIGIAADLLSNHSLPVLCRPPRLWSGAVDPRSVAGVARRTTRRCALGVYNC